MVWVRDYEGLCNRVLADLGGRGLGEEARKVFVLISDLDWGTRYNYLVTFKKWVQFCRNRDLNPSEFDLVSVKEFLSKYKNTTRSGYAFRLRRIFKFNGEMAEFKVKYVDNELPECLTEDEVTRVIDAADNLKWRTIYRLTYDAAMREHEVLGMKIKHVKFDEKGAEVFIPSTKSQSLWLRLVFSAPLLLTWINQHPDRDNPDAWLFPGRNGKHLSYIAFYMAIKRTVKKVGIRKRVFPHLLRHSRLAWLKKYGAKLGISDSVICVLYGRWSPKNAHRMLDRYGRVYPEEANEIILKAYGKLDKDGFVEQLSRPQECPRCRSENDALAKYCKTCGMVLSEKEAQELMAKDEALQIFEKLLKDPDFQRDLKEFFAKRY